MLRGREVPAGGRDVPLHGSGAEAAGRRPRVLHPFLIGIFPILSLYAHNVNETPASSLAWPIGLAWLGTSITWLALRLMTRDASRAGLATSLLVALFFGFGSVSQFLNAAWAYLSGFWVGHRNYVHPLVVLALLATPTWAILRVVFRRLRDPGRWTAYLNAFTFILVALPTAGAVSARMRGPASPLRDRATATVEGRGRTPDIYFIVLDGYARTDVMKDLFGFDNAPFVDRLERRGFFVGRRSTSNYCQTRLSIASTLNADYLDRLIDPTNRDLLPVTSLIQDNLVARMLRPRGYKFVTFSTGFEPTDCLESDLYLLPRSSTPEFQRLLVEMTPIGAFFAEARIDDRYEAARDRTLFLLDYLPTIARMKEPTFTFAHVVSPHPPFIFGEDGEDVSPRGVVPYGFDPRRREPNFGTPAYFRESYRKQSIFLTNQVERMIDRLLAESPEPPIIILQSDHGSWLRYHPDDVEATDLRERFGILNCIYLPDRETEGLTDRMTSVNTFRAVLTNVFGADLPPLIERSFFSTVSDPLVFTDVTERLHSDREKQRQFQPPKEYPSLIQQF